MEFAVSRSLGVRVVSPALHRVSELIASDEGRDKERDDEGNDGLDLGAKMAVFEIDATRGLGLHDSLNIIEDGWDETKGQGDNHGNDMRWESNELERVEIPFKRSGEVQRLRRRSKNHRKDDHEDEAEKDSCRFEDRIPINDETIDVEGRVIRCPWDKNVDDQNEDDHDPEGRKRLQDPEEGNAASPKEENTKEEDDSLNGERHHISRIWEEDGHHQNDEGE